MSTPRIRWIDLAPQTQAVRAEVAPLWDDVIAKGAFSGGEQTAAFEREWAAYLGVPHAIGCSDGTSAIVLALRGLGVGPGHEVLTAPTSFFATAEAIALTGARPTFADVLYETGNLDPEAVARAIGPRTRAIVAVHLTGRPAPIDELAVIASRHGLLLLEDAAQAHGALLGGKRIGSLADAASFSFYPTKNLGAFGEGGAVTTRHDDAAARVRELREHGQGARHRHDHIGYNARLDGLQAAVLRCKLRRLDGWNDERRALAARYLTALAGLPLGLPGDPPNATHVYHLFTVRTERRAALAEFLRDRGIETSSHYPTPIHLQPVFASYGHRVGDFPQAERYANDQLSLPLYPGLAPEAVDEVAAAIRQFFG